MGSMSVIGPRPIVEDEKKIMEKKLIVYYLSNLELMVYCKWRVDLKQPMMQEKI